MNRPGWTAKFKQQREQIMQRNSTQKVLQKLDQIEEEEISPSNGHEIKVFKFEFTPGGGSPTKKPFASPKGGGDKRRFMETAGAGFHETSRSPKLDQL